MATTTPRRPLLRRPLTWTVLGVGAVLAVVALLVFQPWKLVVDQTVDEALPVASAPAAADAGASTGQPAAPAASGQPAAPAPSGQAGLPAAPAPAAPSGQAKASGDPVVIARGRLISHEHDSSGSVQVLRLADGSRVLRLQDLRTSNGPVLKVWLADAPVLAGRDGWHVFDDGRYVDLGALKGNIGSSNYPIPADVDLARLGSVTIWCDRFDVSFAAAALTPTGA